MSDRASNRESILGGGGDPEQGRKVPRWPKRKKKRGEEGYRQEKKEKGGNRGTRPERIGPCSWNDRALPINQGRKPQEGN